MIYDDFKRAFKMHGWCDGNVKEECEAVLELGRHFRGRMNLMLDPACKLRTFADALAVGRACDEAGFFWYEDPMRDGGWSQHFHTNYYELALVGPKCANAMPPVYADGYNDELGSVGADGCFSVPGGPGLGVSYDWEFIRKHRMASHEFK